MSCTSAVNRLPTELLSYIFSLCVHEHYYSVTPRSASDAPWSLTKVCRSWRVVAIAFAPLWASMEIRLETPQPLTRDPFPLLRTALTRSGTTLLEFEYWDPLYHDFLSRTPLPISFKPQAEAMFTALLLESHRWKSANLVLNHTHAVVLRSLRGRLRALEDLSLATYDHSGVPNETYTLDILADLPALQVLEIDEEFTPGIVLSAPTIHSLPSLVEFYDHRDGAVDPLQGYLCVLASPKLTTCHLRISELSAIDREFLEALPLEYVVVSPVQDLVLSCGPILQRLALPNISSLTLGALQHYRVRKARSVLLPLHSVLARDGSGRCLASLTLNNIAGDDTFLEVIPTIHSLCTLKVNATIENAWSAAFDQLIKTFVERLGECTQSHFPSFTILPSLSNLEFNIGDPENIQQDVTFVNDAFASMVVDRKTRGSLKSVKVFAALLHPRFAAFSNNSFQRLERLREETGLDIGISAYTDGLPYPTIYNTYL